MQSIRSYVTHILMGIRNFHFFRLGRLPALLRSFTSLEKKIIAVALATAIVSGSFLVSEAYFGSTDVAPDYGGRFTEGIVGAPRFINPALSTTNSADADLARVVYSGVLRFDAHGKLQPDLANALPTLSEDGKQYTIILREGLTWHDGVSLTADDIIFTIQLIQNPAYASPLRFNWNKVEASKIDDRTVVLSLREPTASFITNFTQGILPKHIWEGVEPATFALSKFNLEPIGSGPFAVSDIKKSDEGDIVSMRLVAFERYAHGRPYLDELEFKFYSSYDELIAAYHGREVMGLGYIPFDKQRYLEKSSRITLHALSLPQYQALFFNRSKSQVLADKNVRAALSQSVDRNMLIDALYLGTATAALGPIPKGYVGYNPGVENAHIYNLENARKLLAETGFTLAEGSPVLQKGDVPLEFTITTNNFPLNVQTAELLQQQWEAIGFKINLKVLTIGELEQNHLRPREYQTLLFSENVGADPDPYFFWHSSQRSDPGLNLALFNSKEADQLIAEARTNADPGFREPRYLRFQELIVDDIPAVFLVNSVFVYGVHENIKGIELSSIVNQSDRFLDIHKWYIETKRTVKESE